jgi:hypothetical protein
MLEASRLLQQQSDTAPRLSQQHPVHVLDVTESGALPMNQRTKHANERRRKIVSVAHRRAAVLPQDSNATGLHCLLAIAPQCLSVTGLRLWTATERLSTTGLDPRMLTATGAHLLLNASVQQSRTVIVWPWLPATALH